MKRMLQIWCFLGLVSFIGALYLFPFVYPILHLSITMNRSCALQKAAEFVQARGFETNQSLSVAMFANDQDAQNFTELVGGGKDVFVEMFEKDYYQPYYWKVRFYKEQSVEETEVVFTPQGKLYGYEHKVSEKTPGVSLSLKDAQEKVEEELKAFDVDLATYKLVEHTQEEVVSKRLDHVFTYERTDISMKDGKYRILVKVAGDQVITCKRFIKVPDAFIRTYQEMRSSNQLLGVVGTLFLLGFYVCMFGAFIAYSLYKTRYLSWKAPFYIAIFCAILIGVGFNVNMYPLWGFSYQTHMPYYLFIVQKLFIVVSSVFLYFVIFFLASLLGEGITRMVHGNQVQLWDFVKPGYFRSTLYIQHVAWAYGFVGFFCLYEVVFQFLMSTYFGWWMPASDLSDVNVLSAYLPWFGPIMNSFQAGFTEELLFRAIPLGLLLWLVPDMKKRPGLFFVAMLAQGTIFGLAHAPYPMQPSYARVIELIPVSFGFGYIYCFVGLIPGIMAHYVYDALLMSIPLFVSHFTLQKIIALFFILLPLLIALYSYARGLIELDSIHLNSSWKRFYIEKAQETEAQDDEYAHMPKLVRYIILVCGVLGIFGAYQYHQTSYDVSALEITKSDALKIAQEACQKQFNVSLESWEKYVLLPAYDNPGLNFIWKTYGKEEFIKLQDRYGYDPSWKVRFIRFDTDVSCRAEEYQAFVGPKQGQLSVVKIVPEIEKGACLSQEEAAEIAYDCLKTKYGVEKFEVVFISAVEKDHVHRKDWIFIFKDAAQYYSYDQGHGRLTVMIAGDQVIRTIASIYPGEEWDRAQQSENMLKFLVQIIVLVIVWMCTVYAWMVCAWKMFKKSRISAFLTFWLPVFASLVTISIINMQPASFSMFNTVQPYSHQLVFTLLFSIVGLLFGLVGRMLGLAIITEKYSKVVGRNFLPAVEFGIFLYAFASWLDCMFPHNMPFVSSISRYANDYSVAFGIFNDFFGMSIVFSAMYVGLIYFAQRFSGCLLRSTILFVLSALSISGMLFAQNIYYLYDIPLLSICLGSVLFAGYHFVFRYDLIYVFVSFATWFFIDLVQPIFMQDIPGSGLAYFIAAILFAGAVICMLLLLDRFSYRK